MNVEDLIKHLSDLPHDLPVTFISWDESLKRFAKWSLAGVSERGEILTGELIDSRQWPENFA